MRSDLRESKIQNLLGGMPPDPPRQLVCTAHQPYYIAPPKSVTFDFCPPLTIFLNEGLMFSSSKLLQLLTMQTTLIWAPSCYTYYRTTKLGNTKTITYRLLPLLVQCQQHNLTHLRLYTKVCTFKKHDTEYNCVKLTSCHPI